MSDQDSDPVQKLLYDLKQKREDITDVGLAGPGQPHTIYFEEKVYLSPETLEEIFKHNYILTEVRGGAATVSPIAFPDSHDLPMSEWDSHASQYGLLADEE